MNDSPAKLLILHNDQKIIQSIRNQIYQTGMIVNVETVDNFIRAIEVINNDILDCIFVSNELIDTEQLKKINEVLVSSQGKNKFASIIRLTDNVESHANQRYDSDILFNEELSPTIFKRIIENSLIKKDHINEDEQVMNAEITKVYDNDFIAKHDILTLLPNRVLLLESIATSISFAKINNSLFSIFFIDLDGFKNINDKAGHQIGDLLLKEAARRLVRITRSTDLVSRHGGDEFVILLSRINNKQDANVVVDKILSVISEPFYFNNESWHVSASIGVAIFPFDGLTPEKLIANADVAMYEAKKLGKNTAHYFNEELNKIAEKKYNILNDIRLSISNDNFGVLLQPQHEIKSRRLIGSEVFIRWQHPEKGTIMPNDFLPFISNSGYINAIGDVVLHKALKIHEWHRRYYSNSIDIAINVEPRQLANDDFVDYLAALHSNGQELQMLSIEITEFCFKNNFKNVKERLHKLKGLGIKLCLDDFGLGVSSLSQLMQLPIDILKIDKKFFSDLKEQNNHVKVRNTEKAIIALSHNLGLKVMAKRVDNSSQLHELLEAGCDYAQGYCYSVPLTTEEFYRYIDNNSIYHND